MRGERAGMTNAIQMMSVFAAKPYESWGRLHDKLLPYLIKLGKRAEYYQRLIGFTEMQFSQANGYQQSRWTAAICMDIVCARLFIRRHSFPDYRRSGRRQRIREVSGMDGCWGLRI